MSFFYCLKKLKYTQKSFLGFKILSSIHSSIAVYFILFIIYLTKPYFGIRSIEIFASLLFNIVAYSSILILILNICLKRSELNKTLFIFLNLPLFLFAPNCVISLIRSSKLLFVFFLNKFLNWIIHNRQIKLDINYDFRVVRVIS